MARKQKSTDKYKERFLCFEERYMRLMSAAPGLTTKPSFHILFYWHNGKSVRLRNKDKWWQVIRDNSIILLGSEDKTK